MNPVSGFFYPNLNDRNGVSIASGFTWCNFLVDTPVLLKVFHYYIDNNTMNTSCRFSLMVCFVFVSLCFAVQPPQGFQNALWGMSPEEVRKASGAANWQSVPVDPGFPQGLDIALYDASALIAGYPAQVTYYFYQQKFFQATVTFNFDQLVNFDFNYNVFISVDRYYQAIHGQTLTFVDDIYDLLRKKYGKKQPIFKGLDPRFIFKHTDDYIKQELWNLRYHPSEYYKRIVTAAYARWDFPKTRVIFSINISAKDKRFDYFLSVSSLDLEKEIRTAKDSLRMQGL
jgi:hypothetical protein